MICRMVFASLILGLACGSVTKTSVFAEHGGRCDPGTVYR
jgi:hypothetical protein